MKTKVILILIISRLFDLFTTYFALGKDLTRESSPIISILNYGWLGFVIMNLIIVSIIIFLLYSFNSSKLKLNENTYFSKTKTYLEYLSYTFFNKKLSFIEVIKSNNINYNIFFHILFYTLPICLIVISVLAGVNNILVILYPTFNNTLTPNQISMITTIFMFILILIISHLYLYNRYRKLRRC